MNNKIVQRSHFETSCKVLDPETGEFQPFRVRGYKELPEMVGLARKRLRNNLVTAMELEHWRMVYTMDMASFEANAKLETERYFRER